jgi:hypothetical protein
MDEWGVVAVVVLVAASLLFVVIRVKTRNRPKDNEFRNREQTVVTFETAGNLLGTIPSEDHAERRSQERQLIDIADVDEAEIQHQHPHAYWMLDLSDDTDAPYRHHFLPDETIEQCISHAIVEFHREETTFCAVENPIEVDRLLAEAEDLMLDLNQEFGWQPGEPHIADRLFNTNVAKVIATARAARQIDFRTHHVIAVMRSFGRAANGGRNELAKVMAVRRLLGSGRLTEEELHKLHLHRQLFGDDFAEAAGYVDHLTRTEELVAARRLGITASRETERDNGRSAPDIAIGRNVRRPFDRRPPR